MSAQAMNPAQDALYQEVVSVLNEYFEIPADEIRPQSRLGEDLDIDSIDAVDLIVQMQQRLGRRLQPDSFKSVRTVDDVVKALDDLVRE